MPAPTISWPTTGTDPKDATIEDLEAQVNTALAALYLDATKNVDTADLEDDSVTLAKIRDGSVSLAKMSNAPAETFTGRRSSGTGPRENITASQARTILNVADGATANASDANLLKRTNHTGTQSIDTVDGLQDVLDGKATAEQGQRADSAVQPDDLSWYLDKTQNLGDLADAASARGNIGLGQVDNTADADKPVSAAQQASFDAAQAERGAIKGQIASAQMVDSDTAPLLGAEITQTGEIARGYDPVSGAMIVSYQRVVRNILPSGAEQEALPIDRGVSDFISVDVDAGGNILTGRTRQGAIHANALDLGHSRVVSVRSDETPFDWATAVANDLGEVSNGTRRDGSFVSTASLDDGGFVAPAIRWYCEIAQDGAHDIIVHWHAPDSATRVLEYRLQGAKDWHAVSARQNAVDPTFGADHFAARINNLSPDAVYECRVAGSGDLDTRTFRTIPDDDADLRIVVASDMQVQVQAGDPASDWNRINDNIAADDPHMIILGGDYVSDEGVRSASHSDQWRRFLDDMCARFLHPDGSMIPIVPMIGNHECTTYFDGDGQIGYVDRLFDTLYRQQHDNVGGQGYGWIEVSRTVMVVMLESNHSTPLQPQVQWLSDLLAARAALYRHVIIISHQPPFPMRNLDWDESVSYHQGPAPKILREQILPVIQDYPNIRIMAVGHAHFVMATPPLKIDMAVADANNWYLDSAGVRVIGAGGWGAPATLGVNTETRVSAIDGSSHLAAALSSNGVQIGITPISPLTNTRDDPATLHHWRLDLSETAIRARCINLLGGTYIDTTDNI